MARLVKRSVDADYERLRSLFREQAHQRPGRCVMAGRIR